MAPKKVKDPMAPKGAVTAFFWYSKDQRPKIKEEMPDLKMTEIAKELGKRWNSCPENVKKKYTDMAAKDKTRYQKEKEAYEKKNPKNGAPSKGGRGSKKKVVEEEEESDEEEDEESDD